MEAIAYIIVSLIGFLIGGLAGVFADAGFFPAAWYGLGAVWGVCLCAHCDFGCD